MISYSLVREYLKIKSEKVNKNGLSWSHIQGSHIARPKQQFSALLSVMQRTSLK